MHKLRGIGNVVTYIFRLDPSPGNIEGLDSWMGKQKGKGYCL